MRKRKWVDDYLKEEDEYLIDNALAYDDIYLEIGMGMGDFIVESCTLNPDRFYIGLEKDPTCVARAIKKAKEKNITNLKISYANANNILDYFKPDTVNTIYLHFSDPWPKKGHHKRRLTYNTFLDKYYVLLKDNGQIIFKTDNSLLFNDSLDYFKTSKFVIKEINENYHSVKREEPLTGYESKFIDEGKPIYYARLKKDHNFK